MLTTTGASTAKESLAVWRDRWLNEQAACVITTVFGCCPPALPSAASGIAREGERNRERGVRGAREVAGEVARSPIVDETSWGNVCHPRSGSATKPGEGQDGDAETQVGAQHLLGKMRIPSDRSSRRTAPRIVVENFYLCVCVCSGVGAEARSDRVRGGVE